MAKLGQYLHYLKYAPMVLGVVKQLRGGQKDDMSEELEDTRVAFDDLKKNLSQRMADIEEENARLRTRIRETESTNAILKVLIYTSGGVAILALVLSLIAIIRLG